MATWRDGPRYAPQQRPAAFAEPARAISLAPEPPAPSLPQAPPIYPDAFLQPTQQTPLDQPSVSMSIPRDPHIPYAVAASILTSQTVMPDSRDPRAPYEIESTIAAMPALQAVSAQTYPDVQPPTVYPVSVKDLLNAAYPPLLITLALGILVDIMSVPAIVAVAVFLAARVGFRGKQMQIVSWCAVGLCLVLWIIFHFVNQGMYNLNLKIGTAGQVICVLLVLVDVALQWIGLRRGERPSPQA